MNGYTVEEAARILGIPTERVWDLVARGIFSGARGEDGTWRVHLGGPPAVPAQGSGDGGAASGHAAGGRQRPGELPSTDPSAAELSPFRELLTEFRHLTERYGQALLALGEARGEVAALTSRVSALETRVDRRLPYAEVPSGASAVSPQPAAAVVDGDGEAELAAVTAAPPPVDVPEAGAAEPDSEGDEATADVEPAEAAPLAEVEAPAPADETVADETVADEAAAEEHAQQDEAANADEGAEPDDAENADEAAHAAEASATDAAAPAETAWESDEPERGESDGDGSDGSGPDDGPPEDRAAEDGADGTEPVAAPEQESEEVAAVAQEVEAQAPADEPQPESTEADASRDARGGVEVAASDGVEQEIGEPSLPDEELPSAELPADGEEFETIDDLLVLAGDEEPEAPDAGLPAEPEQPEQPQPHTAEPEEGQDAVAAESAALEGEAAHSSLTAFGVEGGEHEGAQPRRANRLGSEIAAALARADDPSPPELPNGTNGGEQAAERLVTQPEPIAAEAEQEPATPVEDDAQYAAEMEVGSAGWHRVTATAPTEAPPAQETRPSERQAATATGIETRSTRGLAIDPYPDQNELINALGWEQDEIDAIRSLLAGQTPMPGGRAAWPQADPDVRAPDSTVEAPAEAPSPPVEGGADGVAASAAATDERVSEPEQKPAATELEAAPISDEAVELAIEEPSTTEASDNESPDLAEAQAEPAAPSPTADEPVTAAPPTAPDEPVTAAPSPTADEPATASEEPEPPTAAPTFDAPATFDVASGPEATSNGEPSIPAEGSTDEEARLRQPRSWPSADRARREGSDRTRSGVPPFELPGAADLDAALEALRRRSSEEAAAEEEEATGRAHRGEVTIGHSPATPQADRATPEAGEPEPRPSGLDDAAWSRRSPAANAYRRLRRFLGG